MAKVAAPLEGGERKNHKYIKREFKNGKWQYWYKDPGNSTASVASPMKNQNGVKTTNTTSRKTGDWAKAWLENKTKTSSAVKSSNSSSAATKAKAGKAAASKLVNVNPVYKAKITTSPALSNEEYKKKVEELDTEAKIKMEQNEQQYKEAYEKEKESYKEKLLASLASKYDGNIPEDEASNIESKVTEYTKTLWEDVYEPQVKRINSAIEEANKSIKRALKRRYESDSITHSELAHHGIPGQKWGERNGPPYPLGQNQKSSSEKTEAKSKSHISSDQLKTFAKVGAVVVFSGLAVWGRTTLYKSGSLEPLADLGRKFFNPSTKILNLEADSLNYESEIVDAGEVRGTKFSYGTHTYEEYAGFTKKEILHIFPEVYIEDKAEYAGLMEGIKYKVPIRIKNRQIFDVFYGNYEYTVVMTKNKPVIIFRSRIKNTEPGLYERDFNL